VTSKIISGFCLSGFDVLDAGCSILDAGFLILDAGYSMLDMDTRRKT